MHSRVLVVASSNRLPRIECCGGGVAARCTAPDTVHLVSAAATPLGGDSIDIRVVVAANATLRLRSAAATVALPGAGTPTSHARWQLEVAGTLDVDLEPTVVAADARHLSDATLILRDDARVRFRERVQIGRCDERQGFWSGSLRVDRDGQPVLRHRVEVGAGSLADDRIAAPRAAVSEFRCPPGAFASSTLVAGSTVLTLAGGGTLATWQGDRLGD
ncbi:urease accessory protein UreD [Mycobacterium parmense]|uniref:Urease accessory protein UreD n=1 Tax=Mycobacterium parmense TaxID=185642 RepID=A0A7I7YSH5_9MYCO|nr:urease accessory protein UreD [Mycobacterium parmense]MCV7353339.1 urease accessory protein UreD [Mycobacterium parmense]ORW62040.1 urease accessory protein UreD [Mycobacterium parmense]BBZ44104.1 urease accessory protein UreD [Mycobacterium parmense]